MARHPERTKSRSSIFPVKFKGFVKDVKSFTRDFKLERKSEDLGSPTEKIAEAIVKIPRSPTELSAPLYTANLNVQVSLQFDEPLDFTYSRNYEGSPSLVVTEKLCQGLLYRVDHCSQELITRKDANALQRTRNNGTGKPVRFELHIQINRGSEVWAVRTFTSYQKQPITAEAARAVILETHYIIGLFMRHHDDGFVLKDGPIRDDPSQSPEAHPFRPGRVQPMACVPRSYFLQGSQGFESIPGYTIHLKMVNRNHRRKPSEWQNTVEVNSQQTTPLNLAVAESLFFEAAQAMETVLRFERDSFEERHRNCTQPDGCAYWRQHEGDGFELELSIKNNLGPQFEHLRRTVTSNIALLSHLQAGDCDKFVSDLEQAFTGIRDSTDKKMNSMNDLEFRIIELRGRGWALEEPLLFTVSPGSTCSRRSTEAILDRVQGGIADILRRNAMAVRMTAYKRGHLILDKTLVAREPLEQPEARRKKLFKTSKEHVLERLKGRIEKDIELVCKDTCSLDDSEDGVQIPDGTGPKCLPAYDESVGTGVHTPVSPVSPSRISAESAVKPYSIKTMMSYREAKNARNNGNNEESYPPSPTCPPPPIPQQQQQQPSSTQHEEIGTAISPLESPPETPIEATKINSNESAGSKSQREGSSKLSNSPTISGYLSRGRTIFPRLGDAGSTAPTTPSLISGEAPTPRSSHEVPHHQIPERALDIETDFGGGSSANSYTEESKSHRPNFFLAKTGLTSLKRWTTKQNKTPSPLHQGHSASEGAPAPERPPQEMNTSENTGDIPEKTPSALGASIVPEPYIAPGPDSPINSQPTEAPKSEPDADPRTDDTEPTDSMSEYEAALRRLETDVFSQSRLDFEFSPASTTAADSPVDDLSESESLTLSPPKRLSSQTHRSSFGSAGFVGFHEEKIVQVSLRRALMGSPSKKSKSSGSSSTAEKETQRPKTAR